MTWAVDNERGRSSIKVPKTNREAEGTRWTAEDLPVTGPRGELGALVDCNDSIKGFQVLVPGPNRNVFETRGVRVLDSILHEINPVTEDNDPGEDTDDEVQGREEGADGVPDPQLSVMTTARHSRRIAQRTEPRAHAFSFLGEVVRASMNIAEAKRSLQWLEWEVAIDEEVKALFDSGTFEWVGAPPETKVVDYTLQLRLKVGSDGKVAWFKAQLCAHGHKQESFCIF
ncbi:hypothetical protein PI125_g17672 [Phytophthora idaei]|nr:hypothetical protein PI125_g17672 [Phytophthora idaei]KAG3169911.1 hypothetical protein PI126_g2565 [Phytophthora idaei]